MPLPSTPQKPTSVQPGGGTCMAIELAWARFRKFWLRKFCPGYVQRMQSKRLGDCPSCPHDIIDNRDLKYWRNVCGYTFPPEVDPRSFSTRGGFARHGVAEILLCGAPLAATISALTVAAIEWHWLLWFAVYAVSMVALEIVTFFRDPERVIPADPDVLVSPADGKVTHIEEVDEPEFGKALRISIFLSIFNVHVNRCPRDAEVTNVRYFPGEFLDARNHASAVRNEQLWIDLVEPVSKRPMRVKQISGAIARRIVCWLKTGDVLKKGERIGMIKLGSRTDVLIPAGTEQEVCVKVGAKVAGGATVLLRMRAPIV
jgi:phosphatidylserine decarboxylase